MIVADRLRSFAKENPVAYKIWLRWHCFRLGKKKKLPKAGDQLYFDGFPRSGNTYFTAGLQKVFPGLTFANHLHAVAPIRIALDAGVPTFLLMRNPAEAVASYVLHIQSPITQSSKKGRDENKLCELLLEQWWRYYQWVDRLGGDLEVITSERAFSDPTSVGALVARRTKLDLDSSLIEGRWRKFHLAFKERDRTKRQGSTSFPSKLREQQKARVRALIGKNHLFPACLGLYEKIGSVAICPDQSA